MDYSAILIHPDIKGGRTQGELHVTSNKVSFKSTSFNYDILPINLEIEIGGASNKLVFLKSKKDANVSIYTKDKAILKDPVLKQNSKHQSQLKKGKRKSNYLLFSLIGLLTFVVLSVVGLFALKDTVIHTIADQLPPSVEEEIGEQLFKVVNDGYDFIDNDSLVNEITARFSPVINQAKEEGFNLDFYLIKNEEINAFALPGGKIVIHSGLINAADSWEEVLGVLAHETAHVTQRHHVRGLINQVGMYALFSFFVGDLSAITSTIYDLGTNLESLAYSRSFETESDVTGWNYLQEGNINPEGMISFFEKLKKEESDTNNEKEGIDTKEIVSFFSTHPDTEERIKKLESLENSSSEFEYKEFSNYNEFKKTVKTQ